MKLFIYNICVNIIIIIIEYNISFRRKNDEY